MNYELDYFEQLLSMITLNTEIKPEEIDMESEMTVELSRITQRIDTFVSGQDTTLKAYIHYNLRCFERFKLKTSILNGHSKTQNNKEILDRLGLAMDELIDHLYFYFPNEFNPHTIATYGHIQNYRDLYGIKETEFLTWLEANNIDAQLKLMMQRIFLSDPTQQSTFFEIAFRRTLLIQLQPLLNAADPGQHIAMLLISLKYNDHELYTYLLGNLHKRQFKAISSAEQFRDLILFKKAIAQLMELQETEYFSQNPNIKAMLIQAIDEEINFLKEVDFLNSELVHSGILDSTYKVGLSVRQLAFLIFLNVECGVITERKAKTVHQYIIAHVSTKEAEHISEKSFSNGYYVHHPEDIRKVSEFLAKMLALAQKLY
jgi:hypothetical protein